MRSARIAMSVTVPMLVFALATEAAAQACIGMPVALGQFAIEGHLNRAEPGTGYGGRLGANLNNPFTVSFEFDRTRQVGSLGTDVGAELAADLHGFEPSVCPTVGFIYRERPHPTGERAVSTLLPLGAAFGRTVGVRDGLGVTLFAHPKLLYALSRPEDQPEGRLANRIDASGTVGLILGLPLFYATGGVRASTLRDDAVSLSLGLGLRF